MVKNKCHFFLFWSTCKFSTSWAIMFFFQSLTKATGKKIIPSTGFHPRRGFPIPGTVFQILYQWNLDSNRKWDSGFLCTGSLIFHSSISGFRIPQSKFLGFRSLDSQPYSTLNTEVKAMTFKLFTPRGSTDQCWSWGSKTAIKRTPFSELGLYHWLKQ